MPALASDLTAAIRAGTVARHVFVELDHSQGVVRAWDGLGEFVLGGQTYLGVYGMGTLQGVSSSADIQNHEIALELNGVPLAALRETDPSIRDRVCTIRLAWIDRVGAVIGSRIVFKGRGSTLRSKIDVETLSLSAIVRGVFADWSLIPRAYYTNAEQQRRYPNDTGLSEMKKLENAVVTGWGLYPESSGENVTNTSSLLRGSVDGLVLGIEGIGHTYVDLNTANATLFTSAFSTTGSDINFIREETTSANINRDGSNFVQTTSGRAYIDIYGYLRTAGGKLAKTGVGARSIRLPNDIASNGTATTERIIQRTGLRVRIPNGGTDSAIVALTRESGPALPSVDDNNASMLGVLFFAKTGAIYPNGTPVEAGTGNAVSFSGGFMQCNGANVVMSTTGVALTNTGRRIIKSGDAADFLRAWS